MSIIISKHARKQLTKRGINIDDVIEAVEKGEIAIEEINGRIGTKKWNASHSTSVVDKEPNYTLSTTKKYSVLSGAISDLVVIWFFNKNDQKEIATAYWRRR